MREASLPAPGFVDALVADRAGRLPMTEPAFLAFYARTASRLNGYLRKLTGDIALAEDLLQESYLRFLSRGRALDDEDYQRNYLFRIATNLARDHYRRETRRQTLLSAPGDFDALAAQPDARMTAATEGEEHVWPVLATLSPRDRELLLLAYVEGLSHKEIAQITGLMRASIKPLLFRARKRFSVALRSAGVTGPAGRERS